MLNFVHDRTSNVFLVLLISSAGAAFKNMQSVCITYEKRAKKGRPMLVFPPVDANIPK